MTIETSTGEYIAGLMKFRQELIQIMRDRHFTVERIKFGKQPAWRFTQDQGAYKGSNVYEVRQDQLNALWVINTLQQEGFNFKTELNERLHSILLEMFLTDERKAQAEE